MSIREANKTKKKLSCLRCGRGMWTDRCHRVCARCHRRNMDEPVRRPVNIWLPSSDDGFETAPSADSRSGRTERMLRLF